MNRRALLKALPAAVVAGAAPAAALCVVDLAETPVMRMFRQWVAEETRLNGEEGRTMPESQFNADLFAQNELSNRIMEAPAEDARDMIAKALAWTSYGTFELPNDDHAFWAEARALVA
ncbi:hypothetical protein [Paracoccus sp. N5]|uniref:hypothetical protein n=1 Tax=Paracoccus sp. N5 TaxID=1101189 RepID=UPI000377D46B|nr:hypothetical protein [Paracoccus sp. N5]